MNSAQLAQQIGEKSAVIFATAKQHGFKGSAADELPTEIIQAIKGNNSKQLNAAPPKTEPTGNGANGNGAKQGATADTEQNLHAAFFSSTDTARRELQETELLGAEAMGTMHAHQIYMHYLGAKKATLNSLFMRDAEFAETEFAQASSDYTASFNQSQTAAITQVAAASQSGKSLQQARAEMQATIAALKPAK